MELNNWLRSGSKSILYQQITAPRFAVFSLSSPPFLCVCWCWSYSLTYSSSHSRTRNRSARVCLTAELHVCKWAICRASSCGGGGSGAGAWRRQGVTHGSPGAPLMRTRKLRGRPDQSVASEDEGTKPGGWWFARWLRSPAYQTSSRNNKSGRTGDGEAMLLVKRSSHSQDSESGVFHHLT